MLHKKDQGCYSNAALHLMKYALNDPITYVHILGIPVSVVQVKTFKFGTIGALDILIDVYYGSRHNRKFYVRWFSLPSHLPINLFIGALIRHT